jgi:anti-sigma factor RsiW
MVSMNCRRARNLLFDFFDGASNETLRAEVERHLGDCADCEVFAADMTRSLALLKRTPVEPLDETFNWKVKLAIHRERNAALSRAGSASAWVRMWNVRYAVSSGLAFGAVLIAGTMVLRDGAVHAPVQKPDRPAQVAQETRNTSSPAGTKSLPPRAASTMTSSGSDGSHLVSVGPVNQGRSAGPVSGAIDMTESEARIDSLINSQVMRMSADDRERYIQRRIDRLRLHLEGQQPAPAPR